MNRFLATLAVLCVALGAAQATCPTIITRAGWGARAANTATLPRHPAPFVVIHHTAGAACTTQAACAQQMRNVQGWHMDGNGWADIGYNWCVGECGLAYQGRGWNRQGAHAPGYNNQSMGICVLGTFTSRNPNAAATLALQRLINCGVGSGNIAANHWVIGHRQGSATACPGDFFFNNHVRNMPRFNANPSPL